MTDYASLDQVKDQIQKTSNDDDAVITFLINAASRAVDGYCNRPDNWFVAEQDIKYFYSRGGGYVMLHECVDITTVSVKDSPTDQDYTDWETPSSPYAGDGDWFPFSGSPRNPVFDELPYDGIQTDINGDYYNFPSGKYSQRGGFRPSQVTNRQTPTVKVDALWGYSVAAPPQVSEATIIQTSRWYKRGQSSWADTLASREMGTLEFRQSLDPDLKAALFEARLVRIAVGVF